jgi:hypothetical protein
MTVKLYKALIWIQGLYTLLTALWGMIDIDSFMAVTGPKADIWLVKTVSVLLIPIVVCLFSGLAFRMPALPVILVAASTCAGLAFLDFYYTGNGTIRWIYAVDGVIETVFLLVWIYLGINHLKINTGLGL